MSVLWIVPLVFFAAGALLIASVLRSSAEAAIGLRDECARLEEIRLSLVALRAEADVTRANVEGIRARPGSRRADR